MTEEIMRSNKLVKSNIVAYDEQIMHVIVSDLLPDILVALPLKSLIRFNLVSKQWHALISKDHKFRLSLISKQNPTVKGLIVFNTKKLIFDYLPFYDTSTTIAPGFGDQNFRFYPMQSCNGLLLGHSYWYFQANDDARIYVYNLATKKNRLLPKPDGKLKVWRKAVFLAFDPAKSPHYKVVALIKLQNSIESALQIYIYSSDSNSWRVSGCEPFDMIQQVNYDGGVYCNGAIHWITPWLTSGSFYFSVEDDVIKPMPDAPVNIPSCAEVGDFCYSFYVGESRGHLLYARTGFKQLEIYEMNKDYSGWFIKYNANVFEIPMKEYEYRFMKVLSIICGEEDADHSFLVLWVSGKVIRFDLVSNTSHILHHHMENNWFSCI